MFKTAISFELFKEIIKNGKVKRAHVEYAKPIFSKWDLNEQNDLRMYDRPHTIVVSYDLLSVC